MVEVVDLVVLEVDQQVFNLEVVLVEALGLQDKG
jgi:hypothetical protein